MDYFFTLREAERRELAEYVLQFSNFAVSNLRSRMDMLLYGTGEKFIDKAVKKLLPSVSHQFQYYASQGLVCDRERYEQEIGERYLNLCHRGEVRDANEQSDSKVLENIAITRVLSREVVGHLQIPGLREHSSIQELEERPDTLIELGLHLQKTVKQRTPRHTVYRPSS